MGYMSFTNTAHFEGNPSEIWHAFVNPAVTGLYTEHQTTFVPGDNFALLPGQVWTEHHGEECDFDVVKWVVVKHTEQSLLEFNGKQRGIRQYVTLAMEPSGSGYQLSEGIRFVPAIEGKFGHSLLSWLFLATGLLSKFANDKGESLDLLQDYLVGKKNGTTDAKPSEQ